MTDDATDNTSSARGRRRIVRLHPDGTMSETTTDTTPHVEVGSDTDTDDISPAEMETAVDLCRRFGIDVGLVEAVARLIRDVTDTDTEGDS
jgi:hypothetical protein